MLKESQIFYTGKEGREGGRGEDDTARFCQLDLALEPPVCNPYSDLKVSIIFFKSVDFIESLSFPSKKKVSIS